MSEKPVKIPTRAQVARDVCGGVALVSAILAISLGATWAVLGAIPYVVHPGGMVGLLAFLAYVTGAVFLLEGGFDG
jgi:hypothetical protein